MAIIRTSTHAEHYRLTAADEEITSLSGRGPDREKTDRVAHHIRSRINLQPEHTLVDVGCGDGTLLQFCECRTRIGILPTPEEQQRLQAARPNLVVMTGLVQEHLPLADARADVVVCNGVLLLLANLDEAAKALAELARIVKPHGEVFLGEVPEYRPDAIDHSAPWPWLRSLYRKQGLRGFVAGVKDIVLAALGAQDLMFHPEPAFVAAPDDITAIARNCGLQHEWHARNPFAPERWDFLFRKAATE